MPEASLESILEEAGIPADDVRGQRVDFYAPLARLVIEIDGGQHAEDAQRMLDERRSDLLRLAGIRTLRIQTKDLANMPAAVSRAVSALQEGLALSACYPVTDTPDDLQDARAIQSYEQVMRIQVALLEVMMSGMLSPDASAWRICLKSDAQDEDLKRAAEAALDDLFFLLQNLACLANVPFTPPRVTFANAPEDANVTLDVSAFRIWDDSTLAEVQARGTVFIRTDSHAFADHFRISSADAITYDMSPERRQATDAALGRLFARLFGHDSFRPGQLGIIRRALARKPTLGILPTGSGKSACYQMAALLQPSLSFVVCPIISLMQDQERALRDLGVSHVARLDSQMSASQRSQVRTRLGQGRYQLIWVSPERFQDAAFRQELLQIARRMSFGYAVIDEVHCLSEWGHDFRVSYLLLSRTFATFCPGAQLLGLTATASRDVLADLKAELGISSANIQTTSQLSRSELHFHIRQTTPKARLHDLDQVLDEVARRFSVDEDAVSFFQPKGPATTCGIVFANTRSGNLSANAIGCEELKDHLTSRGIPAETYHSGRGDERVQIQQAFMDDEFPIMVATKSFGMGIDKRNVRFTVHANLPWSIEAFYQEAGRAGRARTSNESDCYVLFAPDPDPERTRKLFSPGTSIQEIHDLQPELEGDLGTMFFLWNLGYASLEEELTRILQLLALLDAERATADAAVIPHDAVDSADVRQDHRGMQTEKALYKLAICGFVEDWTHDWNANALRVSLSPADGRRLERAESAVEDYISRHSPGFSFANPRPQDAPYVSMYLEAKERADELARYATLIEALLKWTNDTIVYSRRAAIGNMLALCQSGMSDEQLSAFIDGYFQLDSDMGCRIQNVAENPSDMASWLDVFYEKARTSPLHFEQRLRPPNELATVQPLCARIREMHPSNIGIEWASLMAKLAEGSFTQDDVSDQLSFVLDAAYEGAGPDFDELVDQTSSLVARLGRSAQAAYDRAIFDWEPDR